MKKKEILTPFLLAILLTIGGIFYKPRLLQDFLHFGYYSECWSGGTFLGPFYLCNQYFLSENGHYYFLIGILLLNFSIIFVLYRLVKLVKKQKIIIGILGIIVLLLVGLFIFLKLRKPITQKEQFTIATDKNEYMLGEPVKIKITNNTNEEKQIRFPFYSVERLTVVNWTSINTNVCTCSHVMCKIKTFNSLQPSKTYEAEWKQEKIICDDGFKRIQVPEGKFRIKSEISSSVKFQDAKTIYSNEFRIKEKMEKQCEKGADCDWILKDEECFCGNVKFRGLGSCVISDSLCYCDKTTHVCKERSAFGGE